MRPRRRGRRARRLRRHETRTHWYAHFFRVSCATPTSSRQVAANHALSDCDAMGGQAGVGTSQRRRRRTLWRGKTDRRFIEAG